VLHLQLFRREVQRQQTLDHQRDLNPPLHALEAVGAVRPLAGKRSGREKGPSAFRRRAFFRSIKKTAPGWGAAFFEYSIEIQITRWLRSVP
jgi:hypothetical protein